MEEAKNAGYVLSEDAVRSLDAYDDAMKRSELQTEGFRKQVAAATAEAATGMENARRAAQGFGQSLVALPGRRRKQWAPCRASRTSSPPSLATWAARWRAS